MGVIRGGRAIELLNIAHATEADVGGRAVGSVAAAGIDPVAVAVTVMAQETTAAHDAAIRWLGGAGGVGCGEELIGVGSKVVPAPFPDVAGHLVESVTVGSIRFGGSGAAVSVGERVLVGKVSLPDIHAVFAVGFEFIAPRVALGRVSNQAAPRRKFPLCFSGESFTGPGGVSLSIVPRQVHGGVRPTLLNMSAGPFGVSPGCAIDPAPPRNAEGAGPGGFGLQLWRKQAVENEGPTEFFRLGLIAGCIHEVIELGVGDCGGIDPER